MIKNKGWSSLISARIRPNNAIGLALVLFFFSDSAHADLQSKVDDYSHPMLQYKLTSSYYQFTNRESGFDTNLRRSSEKNNYWLGYFESANQGVYQSRAGFDRQFGEAIRVTPSLQIATQGFVGGSLQVETGDLWFIGGGIGRTNLRPYWNLNFDPNDSYNLTGGYKGLNNQTWVVQYVRDNRENPDQRHLHFYVRQATAPLERITLDFLYKEGLVEDAMIHRWGVSVAYDWPEFFLRLAYDPKANFGPEDMWRLSAGVRFWRFIPDNLSWS